MKTIFMLFLVFVFGAVALAQAPEATATHPYWVMQIAMFEGDISGLQIIRVVLQDKEKNIVSYDGEATTMWQLVKRLPQEKDGRLVVTDTIRFQIAQKEYVSLVRKIVAEKKAKEDSKKKE